MPIFNFLKNSLSIVDVIAEYVPLKQAGNYWKAPCPFHHEKEASFTVSPDKQIFYCFGCHAKGDLISFISKKENLSQFEAAKYIIDRYKIELPQEIKDNFLNNFGQNLESKNNYFNACNIFSEWIKDQLLQSPDALNYLHQRDIDDNLINYFGIGYFPGGARNINSLLKFAGKNKLMAKDFIDAGILVSGKSVLYSPFEERIIFPINDILSRCCGFGGRIFRSTDERAKYYNSKESSWFLKGKLLFGLDRAKNYITEKKYLFLVEGYTDCVAMTKYGYKNVVATLGTACTVDHLRLLSRYANTVYVLYDGDGAGQNAILRLTELCWSVDLELKVIKLPSFEDPASFLEKNHNLDLLIDSALSIFEFFIDKNGQNFSESVLSDQMITGRKILNLIAKIDDSLKREILIHRAAKIMGLSISSITGIVLENIAKNIDDSNLPLLEENVNIENNKIDGSTSLEEHIFSVIINNIDETDKFFVPEDLIEYFSDHIQILLKKLQNIILNNNSSADLFNLFLESLDNLDRDWVVGCSLKFDQSKSKEIFDELLLLFSKKNWRQIMQDIKLKMHNAQKDGDEKRAKDLFMLFSRLKDGIQARGLI